MKIIRRGTPPREKEYKFRCNCGTIFECVESEGRTFHDPREQGTFLIVRCPVCECETTWSPK